ncbi:hypothetical protein Dsin_025183 [Dipteronia sinensis]|uniref:RNase H type-1 domain-containing protein n=1 Tax=Dipteronia sinensis TaxID=43782 RepID=A0AAD9ZWV1_9ROSI|nr:hypothetical protein Dsin_025183 [Dipteronia sinensis]
MLVRSWALPLNLIACISAQIDVAIVVLHGIIFAVDSGSLPAVIESDAKSVVDLINDRNTPVADILVLLSRYPISVSFTNRGANCAMHSLAKMSITLSNDRFWQHTGPPLQIYIYIYIYIYIFIFLSVRTDRII